MDEFIRALSFVESLLLELFVLQRINNTATHTNEVR